MALCIYCSESKGSSLEHIVPDALGGSYLGDLFKTRRVCERCNNILGLFADGLYIKSYFSQANKALAAVPHSGLDQVKALPLHYFGYMDFDNCLGYANCEMWITPYKGIVFHFHNNREERYSSYAGGNPILKQKNGGLAIYINSTLSEVELRVELRSFHGAFRKADRVVSKVDFVNGMPANLGRYPTDEESAWIDWYEKVVVKKSNNRHASSFQVELGYADRMMAKIAIGLAHNLFGDSFLESVSYDVLKSYMWQKDYEERIKLGVHRMDSVFFDAYTSPFEYIPSLKKNVSIFMLGVAGCVLLIANIFGDEQAIKVTDDGGLVRIFNEEYPDGLAALTDPIYGEALGPMGMTELLGKALHYGKY